MKDTILPSRILNPENPLSIGTSNYIEMRQGKFCLVDKSLLIKEFIECSEKVVIITRPRRFGKSMNMRMVNCFLEKPLGDENECRDIFEGTLIAEEKEIMKDHFQKYPIIYLNFKEIKKSSWDSQYKEIRSLIKIEIDRHPESEDYSKYLGKEEIKIWERLLNDTGDISDWEKSLLLLSKLLYLHHRVKPIVTIDEFDTPINHSYLSTKKTDLNDPKSNFQQTLSFIRALFSNALKDNDYFHKALIVGILRLSKENFLTGLNNSGVCDVTQKRLMYHYGFTENEVKELLKYKKLSGEFSEVKRWYNGYMIGTYENMYNPWSIAWYVKEQGDYDVYWLNTGSTEMIEETLKRSDADLKNDLMALLKESKVKTEVDTHTSLRGLSGTKAQIWGLLLASGYITLCQGERERYGSILKTEIRIPNHEIHGIYREFINKWFSINWERESFNELISSLEDGEIDEFAKTLQEKVFNNISFFDIKDSKNPEDKPERVYHAFVLGMLVQYSDKYQVYSNKEAGHGRLDVMLMPKDKDGLGVIFEFKKYKPDLDEKKQMDMVRKEILPKKAKEALGQIESMQYFQPLIKSDVKKILALGIGFSGKYLQVESKYIR